MNTTRLALVVASLWLSGSIFAAEQTDVDATIQAAQETCLDAARANYGSAEVVSKPTKKSIGRTKGYAVEMLVGVRKKPVNCLADGNAKTTFYVGQL